ncbi:MAG: anti-sigma factor [Hymenobacteraceae bacterium]|nr:anti-sigma factor [Hymenobacteraceae bacterium]
MEETIPAARAAKLPLIALGLALVLALITTFTFYFNWRETEEQLQAAKLDNTVYEKDSFRVSNLIQKNKGDREVIASKDYRAVVLRGTPKSAGSLALAYYNASSRELFIDVSRLPEAPVGQQYQVWASNGTQTTDAGTLHQEKMNEGLLKMNPVSDAKTFMVTLENAGGATAPTTSQTYLTGGL